MYPDAVRARLASRCGRSMARSDALVCPSVFSRNGEFKSPRTPNRWPVDSPESAMPIRPGCGDSLQGRARRPSRPLSRSGLPQHVAAGAARQRLAEDGPAMSPRARRRRRPSAGQPACPVKSPTASRGASIGENCDPEEEGISGGMTTPARVTVGWSYATEHAGPGEFFWLTVIRVRFLGRQRAGHAVRLPCVTAAPPLPGIHRHCSREGWRTGRPVARVGERSVVNWVGCDRKWCPGCP